MEANGIGRYSSMFYEAWSNFERSTGNPEKAEKILQKGRRALENRPPNSTPNHLTTSQQLIPSTCDSQMRSIVPSTAPFTPHTPATCFNTFTTTSEDMIPPKTPAITEAIENQHPTTDGQPTKQPNSKSNTDRPRRTIRGFGKLLNTHKQTTNTFQN